MKAGVVSLDAERERRAAPKLQVAGEVRHGRVFLTFPTGYQVRFSPAQARMWAAALMTLADTAEDDDHG